MPDTFPAVNATLLNASLPLFIVPLSWWLLGERLYLYHLAGFALALGGVVLTSKR
jgi:drug/metabolite transporter (DMT)-like permease